MTLGRRVGLVLFPGIVGRCGLVGHGYNSIQTAGTVDRRSVCGGGGVCVLIEHVYSCWTTIYREVGRLLIFSWGGGHIVGLTMHFGLNYTCIHDQPMQQHPVPP